MDSVAQYALAYSLTTTAGVRALLALAAVAVAAHLHVVHPPAAFAWLGSTKAMWILVGVAVLELVADKVPVLDHGLHLLQVVGKPAAAAILVGGIVHPPSHAVLLGLMAAGALNALGIHAAVAAARGASTMTTAGIANPALSTVEDVGSVGSLLVAFFAPFVAAALALWFTVGLAFVARGAYARMHASRS